jgi:putative flippase GtrA
VAKKKKISNVRAAANFGFLGLIIALGFTLFWPITAVPTLVLNSAIGYAIAFVINFVFRTIKYRDKAKPTT